MKKVFKKSVFKFIDDLATKKMMENRNIAVDLASDNDIKTKYHVNELADSLHPKNHILKIVKVEKFNDDVKRFTFQPTNNKAAFFRAGQYLNIGLNINDYCIYRPYSISSSPMDAKNNNIYQLTIKRKPGGYVSNYILDNLKVNELIKSTSPQGDFYYTFLRDKKNVVAIAGGSGITPFLSMAKAIVEKTEDFKLTILFGNRTKKDIIFFNELKELEQKSNNKVKIVHVLSEEKVRGFENGFIDQNIISKYCKPNDTSFFICGPKIMCKFVKKTLNEMGVQERLIRCEASNEIGKPTNYEDYKNINEKKEYKIKVNQNNKVYIIKAQSDESVLVALQKSKITMLSNCLSGQCSWCRVKLLKGKIYSPQSFANLRQADAKNNIFYTCSSFPVSDLEIETL